MSEKKDGPLQRLEGPLKHLMSFYNNINEMSNIIKTKYYIGWQSCLGISFSLVEYIFHVYYYVYWSYHF